MKHIDMDAFFALVEQKRHPELIAKILVELTKDVVKSMKQEGDKGKTVTVKVRFSDFKTLTRAKTFHHPTDSQEETRRGAFDCLTRLELKKRVRLIGVRVSHLEKSGITQP
jgi:DNA polymerase IV